MFLQRLMNESFTFQQPWRQRFTHYLPGIIAFFHPEDVPVTVFVVGICIVIGIRALPEIEFSLVSVYFNKQRKNNIGRSVHSRLKVDPGKATEKCGGPASFFPYFGKNPSKPRKHFLPPYRLVHHQVFNNC